MRRYTWRRFVIGVFLACLWSVSLKAAPAHSHPYLMPPAEKQRLLQRIRTSEIAGRQYQEIKARADQGQPGDAALVFALEGDPKYVAAVRNHLLQLVRYRGPRLDEDIAAGGHREGNMGFYWDTSEVRWYDLIHAALSPEDRQTIEAFYRKLGHHFSWPAVRVDFLGWRAEVAPYRRLGSSRPATAALRTIAVRAEDFGGRATDVRL